MADRGRHHAFSDTSGSPELLSGQDPPTELLDGQPEPTVASQLEKVLTAQAEEAPAVARQVAGRESRKWYIAATVASSILAVLVSLFTALYVLDDRTERAAAEEARAVSAQQSQDELRTAKQQIDAINSVLDDKGLPPVAQSDDPAQAVAQLVLARVLAQLPPEPDVAAIQATVRAQVLTDLSLGSQVANAVADYFSANKSELRGDPPTPAQIQDAVNESLRRNPPPPGRDGEKGDKGDPGDKGEPGESIKGDPGDKGDTGDRGEPGEPPMGWTGSGDGITMTCARAEPFDPSAPNYTCTITKDNGGGPPADPGNGAAGRNMSPLAPLVTPTPTNAPTPAPAPTPSKFPLLPSLLPGS